jgi:hypothetical protein
MALSGISVTSMPYWRAIPAARSGENRRRTPTLSPWNPHAPRTVSGRGPDQCFT